MYHIGAGENTNIMQ